MTVGGKKKKRAPPYFGRRTPKQKRNGALKRREYIIGTSGQKKRDFTDWGQERGTVDFEKESLRGPRQ